MSTLLRARVRRLRHRPVLRWLARRRARPADRSVHGPRRRRGPTPPGRGGVPAGRSWCDDGGGRRRHDRRRPTSRLRSLPAAVLPDGAAHDRRRSDGWRSTDLFPGEVLVRERVAPDGRARARPPCCRPAPAPWPSRPGRARRRCAVGDTVDVLATLRSVPVRPDRLGRSGAGPGGRPGRRRRRSWSTCRRVRSPWPWLRRRRARRSPSPWPRARYARPGLADDGGAQHRGDADSVAMASRPAPARARRATTR